ncbi:MAG: hypothetical protein MHPSP_003800, partial [Paramarteilia canceri]
FKSSSSNKEKLTSPTDEGLSSIPTPFQRKLSKKSGGSRTPHFDIASDGYCKFYFPFDTITIKKLFEIFFHFVLN